MTNIIEAVENGINITVEHFKQYPFNYFTEEDVRWRLANEIERCLTAIQLNQVSFTDGITSSIHTEYPTPFRCSMRDRRFKLLDRDDKKGQRGHYDVVILNSLASRKCSIEVLRSQYYKSFSEKISCGDITFPFLDVAIELKLFRDLAHANRTESARQQAEYAIQAVDKINATLQPTVYYSKPFANYGMVLLFDNSDLVHNSSVELARKRFMESFNELADWNSIARTLFCLWVTPQNTEIFRGRS